MAELAVPKVDSLADEDPPTKRRRSHIDPSANEGRFWLSDYIDRITLYILKVSKISIGEMPEEFYKLSAVKQMSSLNVISFYKFHANMVFFPLRIRYFLDTEIHTCHFSLDYKANRPDSEDFHDILEKWARNEKVIRSYQIDRYFNWDRASLFAGWMILRNGEGVPPECTVVIEHYVRGVGNYLFRVIRADGGVLIVRYNERTFYVHEYPIPD